MGRTVTFPFHMAKRAATMVLPHVSDDDVTPVLTHAAIRGTLLVGTDRYSVAEYDLAVDETNKPILPDGASEKDRARHDVMFSDWVRESMVEFDGDFSTDFYVPRAALKRLATMNEAQTTVRRDMLRYARVRLEEFTVPKRETVKAVRVVIFVEGMDVFSQIFVGAQFVNYPPVDKLFSEWSPAEDASGNTFGVSPFNLEKIGKAIGPRTAYTVTLGQVRNQTKLAPLLVKVPSDKRFRALVQPNLAL